MKTRKAETLQKGRTIASLSECALAVNGDCTLSAAAVDNTGSIIWNQEVIHACQLPIKYTVMITFAITAW